MYTCLGAAWIAAWTLLPDVRFDVNKATIRPDSFPELDAVGAIVRARGCTFVEVQGHLDRDPDYEMSRDLSKDRAKAVRDYLIERTGVAREAVVAHGFGGRVPRVDPREPGAALANRRIEIVLGGCAW